MNVSNAGASAAVAIGGLAAPASAARQRGLVNVYAEDTTVQVPIGVAANVCGVGVAVLAEVVDIGDVNCTAEGVSIAQDQDGGNGNVNQDGLVNLALVDTTVQVPVTVAANICGVSVAALASVIGTPADTICDAAAAAQANG